MGWGYNLIAPPFCHLCIQLTGLSAGDNIVQSCYGVSILLCYSSLPVTGRTLTFVGLASLLPTAINNM